MMIHRRRGRANSAKGFTLIELLVVMAIIALLISILLPSLASARRQSKESACLARIKNIATSSHVYAADDRSGLVIPVHPMLVAQSPENPTFIGAYEWGGKSGIGKPGRVDGPADGEYAWITSHYGTKAGVGPATRPLNDILYPAGFKDNLNPTFDRNGAFQDTQLDLDLYKCPADDGPPRGGHCAEWVANRERSSYDHFGNSYAANLFWSWVRLVGHDPDPATTILESHSPFLLPLSRIPNPTRTLMYEENIGRWAWACGRAPKECTGRLMVDPGPTKVVRGWHGADWTYNRSFVDGHAARQKVLIEGTGDEKGYYEHYRTEQPRDPVLKTPSSVPERCFTIRGDGWQKDTWPNYTIVHLEGWRGGTRLAQEEFIEGCLEYAKWGPIFPIELP